MELLFVSGSHSHFSSSSPDYLYRLNISNSLPRPHKTKPWNTTKISPLRDRLMIEWIFAQRETLKELSVIVKSLDQELDKLSPAKDHAPNKDHILYSKITGVLRKVIVGISCDDGYELSPCFVEKLYDHYKSAPPIDNLLIVKRQHTMPESRLLQKERLKWQQYPGNSSSLRRKSESEHVKQIKHVTNSKEWVDMPQELSTSIEHAFERDPLQCSVKIENIVVDFESGMITSILTKQVTLLRCTLTPRDYTVNVRAINHQIYKGFVRSYEAAGILPYSVHPVTGEAVFLLGRLTYDRSTWCDFGGMKSRYKIFKETPASTAARECCEESLGVFGSTDQLLQALKNFKENNVFKVINETQDYVGHYLRIPFDHYPAKFATRMLEQVGENEGTVEVDSMRWVPLSSLRNAVGQIQLSTLSYVKVQPINETDGSIDSVYMRLRKPFVQSLCIAEDYGILDFIENIAFILHHEGGMSVSGVDSQQDDGHPKSTDAQPIPNSGKREKERSSTLIVNNLFMVDSSCKDGASIPGSLPVQFDKTALMKQHLENEQSVQSKNSNDDVIDDDVTNDDVAIDSDIVNDGDDVIADKDIISDDNDVITGNDDVITKSSDSISEFTSSIAKGGVTNAQHTTGNKEDLVKSKVVDSRLSYQAGERRGMMYYGMISGTFYS